MLGHLNAFLKSFSKLAHDIGTVFFIPVMTFLVVLSVIFRYFFNIPLEWGEEAAELLLFLIVFFSMIYTWDQKRHIRIEIVYEHLKGRLRLIADIVSNVVTIIFFGLLCFQVIRLLPYMIKTHETGEALGVPYWPFWVIMGLIGFIFSLKLVIETFFHGKEIEKK